MPETPGGLTQETQSRKVSTDKAFKTENIRNTKKYKRNGGAQPTMRGSAVPVYRVWEVQRRQSLKACE